MNRFIDAARFALERLLLRGLGSRLVLMALAVVTVSILGGTALWFVGSEETWIQDVWWAFLRLTDPGYLGDDEGVGRRIISTVLTISGYVLFLGALIAILTQALNATIQRLQRGETSIVMSGHIVLLGLTERTHIALTEILRIEPRVERFLARLGRRRDLRVVVLVDELDESVRYELMEELGDLWDDSDIILRSGSPLEPDHLDRVDFSNAAAILIPGGREEDDDLRDATVIKTLLTLVRHPNMIDNPSPPRLVAELDDPRLIEVVRHTYSGQLTLLPSDAVVGRLIVQNLRHPGLSWVTSELLAMDTGADVYFHDLPELYGLRFDEAVLRIPHGVVLGIVRPVGEDFVSLLNPDASLRIQSGDRLAVASSKDSDEMVIVSPEHEPIARDQTAQAHTVRAKRSVLVLGWNHRLITALAELETYTDEQYDVTVVSIVSADDRIREMERRGLHIHRTHLHHLVGDYTNVADIDRLPLSDFDNLVILGRSNLDEAEQSDARTLMASLIVRDRLRGRPTRPTMLVELLDPDNASLFDDVPGEVVLSPTIMGRLLAHVAMRPELSVLLDEIFTVGGVEIVYRKPDVFGLSYGTYTFDELTLAVRRFRETLLGVRNSESRMDVSRDIVVAPDRDTVFDVGPFTRLAVLTTLPPPTTST